MKHFTCIITIAILSFIHIQCSQANDTLVLKNINQKQPTENTANSFYQVNNLNTDNELREMLTDTKFQLLSAQEEIAKLQDNNFNLKKTISEIETTYETLEKQNKNLAQLLSEKENNIRELSKINSNNSNDIIASKEVKITELQNIISTYENKINELTQSNNELTQMSNQKIATIINTKESHINELTNTILTYRKQVDDLSSQLISINNELNSNKNNTISLQSYEKLAAENKELQRNITNLQTKIASLQAETVQKPAVIIVPDKQDINAKVIQYLKGDKSTGAIFYLNLAKVYQDMKDYKNAIENYNLALTNNSELAQAYKELGLLYAETGNYENSAKKLKDYLKYIHNEQEQKIIKEFISKLEQTIQS